MSICYANGTVVSVPDFNGYRHVNRSVAPAPKCFGVSFKTKMKIFDAAHVQATEMSNLLYGYQDSELGETNMIFLTPTFELQNFDSYVDGKANEAVKRFTDNLTKRHGCSSYLWVKEFTKNLVPHYHMICTMPFVNIERLNRAWSHARGDMTIVKNALRTGWDSKNQRPIMKVKSYKHAVGYCAKYITKADGGDLSVLKPSCKIKDRKTWEYRTGHSTKCYGMSQNLHRKALKIDHHLIFHLHPYLKKTCQFRQSTYADFFFFNSPKDSQLIYQFAKENK